MLESCTFHVASTWCNTMYVDMCSSSIDVDAAAQQQSLGANSLTLNAASMFVRSSTAPVLRNKVLRPRSPFWYCQISHLIMRAAEDAGIIIQIRIHLLLCHSFRFVRHPFSYHHLSAGSLLFASKHITFKTAGRRLLGNAPITRSSPSRPHAVVSTGMLVRGFP